MYTDLRYLTTMNRNSNKNMVIGSI